MNIKYVFNRILKMDYKCMIDKINTINQKTGKNKIEIVFDMLNCAIKYGAGYMDYDLFEMYNLTNKQRDTYLTRGRNNKLVKRYNNKKFFHVFDNKCEFNEIFDKFLQREWIKVSTENKEDVMKFIKKHKTFMIKPITGECGKGIIKISKLNFESIDALYNYICLQHSNCILEEEIKQNRKVSSIYQDAINTVRVVTILKNGKIHIICTYFRIGNGSHVDNFNSGGMVAPIDLKTGTVIDKAIDKNKNSFENHPISKNKIKGFKFPDWEEAMEMCKEAAKIITEVAYIGWDIGFSENGPVIVEGNCFPGHDIYQLPGHTTDKIGIMPRFNEIK